MGIRTIMGIMFAFDVCGQFIIDYGMNINHGVHLGGYVAGLILYRTLVRKFPMHWSYELATKHGIRIPYRGL